MSYSLLPASLFPTPPTKYVSYSSPRILVREENTFRYFCEVLDRQPHLDAICGTSSGGKGRFTFPQIVGAAGAVYCDADAAVFRARSLAKISLPPEDTYAFSLYVLMALEKNGNIKYTCDHAIDVNDGRVPRFGLAPRIKFNTPPELSLSICVAVRNKAQFLRETLDAILAQTWRDWELLVKDDASSDSSPVIVEEYARKDARVQVLPANKTRRGQGPVYNEMLPLCKGERVILIDCDDVPLPTMLAEMMELARGNPEADCFAPDNIVVDGEGNEIPAHMAEIGKQVTFSDGTQRIWVTHSGRMLSRKCLETVGGYDERLIVHQDLEHLYRLIRFGFRVKQTQSRLMKLRLAYDSSSTSETTNPTAYMRWLSGRIRREYAG